MSETMMVFKSPQDVVAIFHVSFHPTRGNVLDWYFSADDGLDVENLGLEFSALPSGLHQLDDDVIYFTASEKRKSSPSDPSSSSAKPAPPQTYHALALFRRRRTAHPLYRGFLLGSLGILVSPRAQTLKLDTAEHYFRARPWRHLLALKDVAERCYSRAGSEPDPSPAREAKLIDVDVDTPDSHGEWFEPAKEFFDARRYQRDLVFNEDENSANWKDELHDEVRFWLRSSASAPISKNEPPPALTHITPTLALPSLLTLLGPASLTLYRHLLTRKRILFYTKPPVEYACAVCYAAADMVRNIQEWECARQREEHEFGYRDAGGEGGVKIPPRHEMNQPARVLGMVTLHDLLTDKLNDDYDNSNDDQNDGELGGGRGWIACTTDALFLEKPAYYDLLIDLTSVGVSSSSTVFYHSSSPPSSGSGPQGASSAASWVFGSGSNTGIAGRPRPTMYISVPKLPPPIPSIAPLRGKDKGKATGKSGKVKKSGKKQVQYKRVQTRWAWSDARLWGELEKVLKAPAPSSVCGNDNKDKNVRLEEDQSESDPELNSRRNQSESGSGKGTMEACKTCGGPLHQEGVGEGGPLLGGSGSSSSSSSSHATCTHSASGSGTGAKQDTAGTGAGAWLADAWQLYEDVCLVCAGAWMGTLRTRNLGLQANYIPSTPMSPETAPHQLGLKRSFSTPNHASENSTWGGSGSGTGKYTLNSMTLPGRADGRGVASGTGRHKHGRSVSETKPRKASPLGMDRTTKSPSPVPQLSLTFGPSSVEHQKEDELVGLLNLEDADDEAVQGHPSHEHDYTLVSPATPDTREGLEMLLHTAASPSVAFPPNLAEAVSKTEGALGVLDVYAEWVVGLVKGKVGDIVKSGNGVVVDEEGEEGEGEEEGDGDTNVDGELRRVAEAGPEREEGDGVTASAIELTSVGEGLVRRSTPPPPGATAAKGKDKDKGEWTKRSWFKSRPSKKKRRRVTMTMTMTPRDLLLLDLNPLSTIDVKYLESIVAEYASRVYVARGARGEGREEPVAVEEIRVNLVVKRGWRDLVGVVLGL